MGKLKNITKMDYADQDLHGYYVRIQRDGKKHAKFFSAQKSGSMDEALAQAISYRDSIIDRWKQYCGDKDETIQYQTTNTGYPGISITKSDGYQELEINLRQEDGKHIGRTLRLPPKNSPKYEKVFQQKFNEAKEMVDTYNRKRFGGRWHQYKKRKELIS